MYFDPGMGSLIIQALIAALAVVGGYFAVVKNKFKKPFGKRDKKESEKSKGADEDDTL